MRGMRLGILLLVVVWTVSGCASAPLKPADRFALAEAETRWLDGCYTCLLEARDTFRRLAVGRARPLLITRLFETEVLIALRERELAVDASESFTRAEALVPELSVGYPGARYLEVARMIPPDEIGTPRAQTRALERQGLSLQQIREIQTELSPPGRNTPFATYLATSLECLPRARRAATDLPEISPTAPMLVKYRLASCPAALSPILDEVVAAVPDFVEADYFMARVPTLNVTSEYTRRQREAFAAAARRFPRSPAVSYSRGALNQVIGDCKAAIIHYEDTIALAPLHEDAAMQRVICLGHIGQFVPSIEGATRIIEAQYYNFAEAYYWRAWNHYQRKDLPTARRDIDSARAVSVNMKVLILGGMIKFDQGFLDLAEADLKDAITLDPRNEQCIARWYYGLVGFAREDWPETAIRFATAGSCYRKAVDLARRELENMRTADVDETFRASQIAGFEAAIKEDTDQEEASYLNTANCHARAGQFEQAREWLARIPAGSVHALTADQLRKQIGG
jgi:tetratricopeptide (TPR) repeat protein